MQRLTATNTSSSRQHVAVVSSSRAHTSSRRAVVSSSSRSSSCERQQPQHHTHNHKAAALAAAAVASSLLLCVGSPAAAQAATAEANFGVKCLGCHVAGGNIIQAGATLFQDDLVKNGAADSASLYSLIYGGKGRMPGFGQDCAPKAQCTFGPKLSDQEVQELVQYVQDQAAAGWKQQ